MGRGAERRGGQRGARGRGGPGVLWDAAVEWRWARDFEQTLVCVSEAPPPPLLLGAQGAPRDQEAAAPPALVSVSRRDGGYWAGGRAGRGNRPPLRVAARAESAGPLPPGARAGGPWRGAGTRQRGQPRPFPGLRGAEDPRGSVSSRRLLGGWLSPGRASARPAACLAVWRKGSRGC